MSNITDVFKRKYASLIYRASLHCFRFFERLGVHVTPVHYYSPIPDTGSFEPELFRRELSLEGVDMNREGQLAWLRDVAANHAGEFSPRKNSGLSLADACILHCMIRHFKPERMVEIGGGESTAISLNALEMNRAEGHDYTFTSVEPYPSASLRALANPYFELVEEKVERLPLSFFADTDMLFIDSSHVSRIGGDVNFEILELVPSLKPGAVVHWHDIMIPGNYWEDWSHEGNKFWNESYMLHAFLQFNSSFRVLWASRYMGLRCAEEMRSAFPFMQEGERDTSFWIVRDR